MTEPSIEDRGRALKRRRLALGIKSVSDLHRKTGAAREAITAAENGNGSPATIERLEAWFDRFEHETSSEANDAAPEAGIVEFTVEGDLGVRVVVRGPITDVAALERSVQHIVEGIRNRQKDGS